MRSQLLKAVIVAVENDKEELLDELADVQASLLLQPAHVRGPLCLLLLERVHAV